MNFVSSFACFINISRLLTQALFFKTFFQKNIIFSLLVLLVLSDPTYKPSQHIEDDSLNI